jgi:superfamily II DNA or RNA helicase
MLIWDRGTLVVRSLPPHDPADLPGVLWDPRTRCWRAPARCYRELSERLGADPLALTRPEPRPFTPPDLRSYQQAALGAWEVAGRRGVVVLPTGAGKTRTAIAAIATTGLATLCIAPTRVLVAQWRAALLAARAPEVGQIGDGVRDVRRVTVATTASARLNADRLGPRFPLLVVDEAHHHAASDEALELFPAPFRLGLTATPPEDPAARSRLEALLGPVVAQVSIQELVGAYLADFELVRLLLDLDPADRRAQDADTARFREVHGAWSRAAPGLPWAAFVAAASRSRAGREALAAWHRARRRVAYPSCKQRALAELIHRHRHARVLVFVHDNATAYAVAKDHLIAPLTCDIDKREREAVLARFARGELGALVSARVLNEGLDVPEADVEVLAGGSQGSREYVQRVGRVLRPAPDKRALVYELVVRDTHEATHAERGRRRLAAG